jgi:hypothetical protein
VRRREGMGCTHNHDKHSLINSDTGAGSAKKIGDMENGGGSDEDDNPDEMYYDGISEIVYGAILYYGNKTAGIERV